MMASMPWPGGGGPLCSASHAVVQSAITCVRSILFFMAWGKRTAGEGQAARLRLHTRGSEGNRASRRQDAAGALPLHAARTIDGETGSQHLFRIACGCGLWNSRVDGSEVRVSTLEPSGDETPCMRSCGLRHRIRQSRVGATQAHS